ncbi:hypothetical protein U9M48_030399 [Paspalum notatum var. saurae]|uniref:BTB domain-containing protein n=1 Tax=Paspalum notatum var. saurae TaxID=547442 RepID=A0AAQ3X3Q2_PASNO
MSSTAASSKPLGSASAIVAEAPRGYHILKISGYSRTKGTPTGESIKSHPFTVAGHRCNKALKAQYKFCLIDDVDEQTPSSLTSLNGAFGELESPKDDSFVVRCDIAVINDFRTEAPTMTYVLVPPSNLHHNLGDLLETEKGADVVFQVGTQTFKAHRCVLAARSDVFSVELFGQMKESDTAAGGGIHIDDMEAHVFKALLLFIYTDSLPENLMNKEEEDAMLQHLLVAGVI